MFLLCCGLSTTCLGRAQTGTNLGPTPASIPVPSSIQFFFGSGVGSAEVQYTGPCVVTTAHTAVTCTSPRGVSSGHLVRVVIGGQSSAAVGPFAYAAPAIVTQFPLIGPAVPGSVVDFTGTQQRQNNCGEGV